MNPTPKKGTCSRCGIEAELIGMDCGKCHYTALVMLYVHKHWRLSELQGLIDRIRIQPISELLRTCPPEAVLMRKIFMSIRNFSHPAKMHEDSLKSSVCEAILKYIGAMKGIAKYEQANGKGTYMRAWAAKVGTVLQCGKIES